MGQIDESGRPVVKHGKGLPFLRIAGAALACLAATSLVFHAQIATAFATLFNDPWDGRIEVALLEHWWNTLRGLEPWQAPLWFSPSTDTLGYNDGYLIFGLLHACFRWCGVDPFLSAELVTFVVRAIGFPGFLLLAHQGLKLAFWPALVGAILFTVANNMVMQMDHAQLVTVSLAPWLWWGGWRCWTALGERRHWAAFAWGLASAALVDSWLMTAVYTLWFTVLFLCILAVFRAGWLARHARRIVAWPVWVSVAVLAAGMAPFLWTYLPTRHETGGHQFSEVLTFAPRLRDLFDLGVGNLLWGQFAEGFRSAIGWTMTSTGEHVVGWPPMLLTTAVAGVAIGLHRRNGFWVAVGAATLLAVLLPVAWGDGQWTAWRLVYTIVPGASAIRGTTRFALVLTLPITLLATYAMSSVNAPRSLMVGLAALLTFEEVNLTPRAQWPRQRYMAELAVASPPAGLCATFIVKQPRDPEAVNSSILMNVEAMMVAERLHLPTLNGHASFVPKYQDLSYVGQVEYDARMATLAIHAGLTEKLCALDLRSGAWTLFRGHETIAPTLGQAYRLTDSAPDGFIPGRGWSIVEAEGRWTDGDTAVLVFRNPVPGRPLRLALRVRGFPASAPRSATISYQGFEVAGWYPGAELRTMVAELPPQSDGLMSVTIHVNQPRSPAILGLGPDTRLLGLLVETAMLTDPAN